jgi:hypothetical protein
MGVGQLMPILVKALIVEKRKTPRLLLKQHNANARTSYKELGAIFLRDLVDVRFTTEHAREAGYKHRKGELIPFGSKPFNRSYTGRKFNQFGHMRPLEFSGETRQGIKVGARGQESSKGVRVIFPGARKFNLRHPKSQINMADEFRTVTQREAELLGKKFDEFYGTLANGGSPETVITKINH